MEIKKLDIEKLIEGAFINNFFKYPNLLNLNLIDSSELTDKYKYELVDYYVYYLFKKLRIYNQFIDPSKMLQDSILKLALDRGWEDDFGNELIKILKTDPEIALLDKENIIKKIPCFVYEAKSQINYLNLDMDNLSEPIIDVGCGFNGYLVKYLNDNNYIASGFDIYVNEDNKDIFQSNWMDYNFKSDSYGTVISHMAFSNHFIREHKKLDGKYIEYAKKYIEILKSLKVGGKFYYAPSLEFIEDVLDKNYIVKRHKVFEDKKGSVVERLK